MDKRGAAHPVFCNFFHVIEYLISANKSIKNSALGDILLPSAAKKAAAALAAGTAQLQLSHLSGGSCENHHPASNPGSGVPLEKKETSNKRRTRLNLKYTPKNPGMYGDDDLTSYNKYMGEVDKGNFEIISAQSERIVNIANISEFRNLGFLYYLLLRCHGNSGLYQESKILKRLAIAFPEIIQCECNTYFLNRQLATLKQCLENFNKIKNKNLQRFLIEISSFTLSVDQTACKKLLMQCL